MAEPKNCLFHGHIIDCNGRTNGSDEHIIQRGVGGSLSDKNIICAACNEWLGIHVDPAFCDLYRDIFITLAPLLSGSMKDKTSLRETTGGHRMAVSAGAVASLTKMHDIVDDDGKHIGVLGPLSQTKLMEDKAKRNGREFTFSEQPFNVAAPGAVLITRKYYDNEVHPRAAVKTALEAVAYFQDAGYLQQLPPDVARSSTAEAARSFVATGRSNAQFERLTPYVMDVTDDLRKFSNAPVDEMSNRLVISCDQDSKEVWVFFQVAETMPWAVRLFIDVEVKTSETLVYQKCLTNRAIAPNTDVRSGVFMSSEDLEWRRFSAASSGAISFALTQFFERQKRSHGQATLLAENRHDDVVLRSLVVQVQYRKIEGDNDDVAAAAAILALLKIRYSGKILEDGEYWKPVKDRLLTSGVQFLALGVPRLVDDEITAPDGAAEKLLALYREELARIVADLGLPDFYVEIDAKHQEKNQKFRVLRRTGRRVEEM